MPVTWNEMLQREEELRKQTHQTNLPPMDSLTPSAVPTNHPGLRWDEMLAYEANRAPDTDPYQENPFTRLGREAVEGVQQVGRGAQWLKEAATGAAVRGTLGTFRGMSGVVGTLDPAIAAVMPHVTTKDVRAERQKYEDWLQDITQKVGDYTPSTVEALQQGQITPGVVAEKSLDVATSLAKAVAYSAIGGPWMGAAGLAADEGGNVRADVLQRLKDREDLDDSEKQTIATLSGGAVGLTSLVLSRIPIEMLGGKMTKALGTRVHDIFMSKLLHAPLGMSSEALEEMATGTVQDTMQYVLEHDADAFDGFVRRRIEEGLYGALGFGMAKGATHLGKAYQQKIRRIQDAVATAGATEAGREKLRQLADIENPSRKDLKNAGVQIRGNLNAKERAAIASAANPEEFDTQLHNLSKLAGRSKKPVEMHAWDRALAVEQARKGNAEVLQNMGLEHKDVVELLKDTWLQEDQAKQPSRIGGKKILTAPNMTKAREAILDNLGNAWKATSDVDAEVQTVQNSEAIQDLDSAPLSEFGQQLTEARRQVAEDSRQERIRTTQAEVVKLQRRRDHYREAAQAARGKGKLDAADAYDKLAAEAGRDISRRLTLLQKSESPVATPGPNQVTPVATPGPNQVTPVATPGPNQGIETPAPVVEPSTSVETEPISTEITPPTRPAIAPPLASEEAGALDLANLSWDGIKKSLSEFGTKIITPKMRTAGKNAWSTFINEFTEYGGKQPEIIEARRESEGRLNKLTHEIRQLLVDFQDSVKKTLGINPRYGIPDGIADQTNQYLRGQIELKSLPEGIRVATKAMREKIDSLSREALNSGAVTGGKFLGSVKARTAFFNQLRSHIEAGMPREGVVEVLKTRGLKTSMAETVASILHNDGLYITRTFDAFDKSVKWNRETMPASVWNDMFNMLRDEDTSRRAILQMKNQRRVANGKPTKKIPAPLTDEQIEWKMEKILSDAMDAGDLQIFAQGKLGRQNRMNLKKRKNLPEEYRRFLGEVQDPVENVLKTAVKVGNLIEKHKVAQQIRDAGIGKFLFTEEDAPYAEGSAVVPIAPEGDLAMEPLAGLYATKDIADMFKLRTGIFNSDTTGMKWLARYYGMESLFQRMKTAWSIQSHMRQVVGNPIMLMANGNFGAAFKQSLANIPGFSTVLQKVGVTMRPKTRKVAMQARGTDEQRQYFNRAVELQLAEQGIEHQMFTRWATRMTTIEQLMDEIMGKTASRIPSKPKELGQWLQKQYGYEDTMFKLAAWEAEKAKYADSGMFDTSTEAGQRALEEYAAKLVRRTNPSYSELPQLIDHVRAIPGFGMFMAFPMSQVVNASNRAMLTMREIRNQHPNPEVRQKIRNIGIKRALSQIAVYSMPGALAAAFKAISGVSDEELEALRRRIAPFARDNTLLALGREDGLPTYINWSYMDPHAYFLDPMYAILRGDSPKDVSDAIMRGAGMFLDPYLQETMGIKVFLDWKRNATEYGSEVYNPDAPLAQQVQQIAWHTAYGTIMPGTFISAARIYKAAIGERSKGGKAYTLRDEIIAPLTGFKIEHFDPKQGMSFQINDFNTHLKRAQKELYTIDREGNVPEWKQKQAVEASVYGRQNAMYEMNQAYEDYRILDSDIDKNYLYKKLADRRISQDDIDQIFTGVVKPAVPPTLRVMERMLQWIDDPIYKTVLTEAREAKLNDMAYTLGEAEGNRNLQSLTKLQEEFELRGISGEEILQRMTRRMQQDQLERFTQQLKKRVGGKYSDQQIRKVAMLKTMQTPFTWTRPRKERALRIAERFDVPFTEMVKILQGENK